MIRTWESPTEWDWMLRTSALEVPQNCAHVPWPHTHLHHLRSGCLSLSACYLWVLRLQVAVKLGLGGEELTTELTGEGALRLLEVLCGDVVLQCSREAESGCTVQAPEWLRP